MQILNGKYMRFLNGQYARLTFALLVGLGGTAMVFQLLDWMNSAAPLRTKKLTKSAVDFKVAPKRKKKIQRKVMPKQQRPRRVSRPRAPLPNLATALSQVNFGIPPLTGDSLMGAQDSFLGADKALNDVVMTANSVDEPPSIAQEVSPKYPPRARAEGVTGHVKIRLLVGQRGQVMEARVIEAYPKGVFEEAALTAIRQCIFTPARYKGQPVKMWAEQVMRFNLG
jgi:protein TonB